jgi:L-ascorbate metabolism protein UlaG (beta-lactamase superfamily)
MDIFWLGQRCFHFKNHQASIITDPLPRATGLPPLNVSADVVTFSRSEKATQPLLGVSGGYRVLNGPGEYEIKDVFIIGRAMYPPLTAKTEFEPKTRNVAYLFQMEEVKICHLGHLDYVPTQDQLEELDNVDVLLITVGGQDGLNAAKAAEVISIIEPAIVVPMHYALTADEADLDPVEKFLEEMGVSQAQPEAKLRVTASTLPLETQVVVLAVSD